MSHETALETQNEKFRQKIVALHEQHKSDLFLAGPLYSAIVGMNAPQFQGKEWETFFGDTLTTFACRRDGIVPEGEPAGHYLRTEMDVLKFYAETDRKWHRADIHKLAEEYIAPYSSVGQYTANLIWMNGVTSSHRDIVKFYLCNFFEAGYFTGDMQPTPAGQKMVTALRRYLGKR